MVKRFGLRVLLWALFSFSSFLFGKISITITPSSLNLNLKAGVFYNSQIEVVNSGDIDYLVKISFYDLAQDKEGEVGPFEPNSKERGAGSWLSSDLNSFPLKSGERKFFKYYINVPKEARGAYAGAILFKIETKKEEQEFGASIEAGIASKLFITVNSEKEGDLNFKEFGIKKEAEEGSFYFILSMENNTDLFSSFFAFLYLKNEKGETIYEKNIKNNYPLFPKQSFEFKYELPKVGKGNYIGVLFLNQNGKDPIIKTISFKVE